MIEWRWGLKEENKEEDGDNKEGSENGPRESQEEVEKETPLSIPC